MCDVIWENMPQNLQNGREKAISSQNGKYKNPNISKTINPIKTKLTTNLRPTIALHGWSNVVQIKSNMAAGHHPGKAIWRHNSAEGCSILQNLVGQCRMTRRWRKLGKNRNRKRKSQMAAVRFPKPEVVLSHFAGWSKITCRGLNIIKNRSKIPIWEPSFFSKIESSFIPAVDWDISSKFGMRIDFHLLKRMHPLTLNEKVALRLYGRQLEKSTWRHNSAGDRLIKTTFGRLTQNHMPMSTHRSKSKQKIEFKYCGHPFTETGSSNI